MRAEPPSLFPFLASTEEIGVLIDCVAATVQSRDAENGPLLHRLQDAYKAAKAPRCPVYGEARGTHGCEVCGGDIINCPVYGPGEKRRREEDARV